MVQDIHKLGDRQYKALVGVSKKDFNELTVVFSECEQQAIAKHYEEFEAFYDRKPSPGGTPKFKTPSQKLFLVLYYLKTYPSSFDVLGFTFNCSGKTAHENLYKFLPILKTALDKLKVLPKRTFESVDEFIEFTKSHPDIIIDATERLHHRKKDQQEQKKYFNGKKKAHTVKNTVIANEKQQVLFVGSTVLGAVHDYRLLKNEFPTSENWFKQLRVWVDLGYIGFAKDYISKELKIPHKKPYKTKNNPDPKFTPEQKQHNKIVGAFRVKVENAIGGIKRYNILMYKFKNKSQQLRDEAIYLAAGLWNFSKGFSFG